jgi:hypothetical protein
MPALANQNVKHVADAKQSAKIISGKFYVKKI